ncbi:hypothetical protein EOA50_07905 [Mesorhizobium sp. M1A.F.Ca.IN.020.30.1.1]|uniref:hypothetical protein n=1 Tax=unclassified Mesorhizobium TaxID=325217 RepID=UPI000FD342D2|nr:MULTISPECIES: hypothetical protein [unclassified Mesorhizobium]RUV77948.1 hypothetical protein EOA50_07905 [Mesorhizobium sp. M1A.F.Ca.IN.020.30.1.1]RWG43277.1 MAG: hypothetical protein EOQ59_00140 [Mesorhizobium sp.]RWG75449.1 MAG: hypothetical protein EOQ66_00230 [Mesorhizobium sp.]TIM76267.1 MAG: hypothetical protein E5Y44_11620 [Mesorhizobium sp.]TIM93176.1 MAG: hypothetical protein E5Y43_00285 [Mesorhizobium sp.]
MGRASVLHNQRIGEARSFLSKKPLSSYGGKRNGPDDSCVILIAKVLHLSGALSLNDCGDDSLQSPPLFATKPQDG